MQKNKMGRFDFFKKRSPEANQPIDRNGFLLHALQERLLGMGHTVEKHQQHLALLVDSEIEIATAIVDNPNTHPSLLHLLVLTVNAKYFPNGIKENIIGVGTTIEEKVISVLNNYLHTTFEPIVDSFSDSHNPDLDFVAVVNGKEVLWHPKLGSLTFQGQWEEQPQNEPFFERIKEKVKSRLTGNKLNWLKLYVSKGADGTIIGECLLNNEPWDEGLSIITAYAKSWKMKSDFQGLKQFIVFRRCDACDN